MPAYGLAGLVICDLARSEIINPVIYESLINGAHTVQYPSSATGPFIAKQLPQGSDLSDLTNRLQLEQFRSAMDDCSVYPNCWRTDSSVSLKLDKSSQGSLWGLCFDLQAWMLPIVSGIIPINSRIKWRLDFSITFFMA